MTHASRPAIEICVCTYRRVQLGATLRSLARQQLPAGTDVSVLVIDNDDRPSARETVVRAAAGAPLPMRYVHCPGANISIARNGALDHASAPRLAFIDDDEEASVGWLRALAGEMDRSGAAAVLGPVEAVYGPDAPAWMRRLDIHSTRPVWVRGCIRTGYTCNVLIDRSHPAVGARRFEPAIGRAGGEDTAYFAAIAAAGGRIGYAEDALVREDVPADRLETRWLLRRRFRMGQTHGRLLRSGCGLPGRLGHLALASTKLAYCVGATALGAFDTARRHQALLRGVLHAGVVSGLAGMRELQLYGGAAPGPGS